MRASEYIHWLTRTDIGMAVNPKANDYFYFTPKMIHKRERYLYQCKLKGRKPVK